MRTWPISLILVYVLTTAADAVPRVATTIGPVQSLVAAVMKDIGKPVQILKGNQSPHTMALRPSQIGTINNADIIFVIGGGLERALEKSLHQSSEAGARVVALIESPGVNHLDIREGGVWQRDDHQQGNHDHGAHDLHVWLDPDNATTMVRQITAVLAQADPTNADRYRRNAADFDRDLQALSSEISNLLAPVRERTFIVFHDAYQYFEKRFGLSSAGSIAVDPDRRPGARRLAEIRKAIVERNAVCIFAEPQFDVAYVRLLAESTSARPGQLDPVGSGEAETAGYYFDLLRNMAMQIRTCLEG